MSINKMKGIIRSDLAYLAHASMSHLIIISPPVKKTISVENCDVDFLASNWREMHQRQLYHTVFIAL